jgi:hypothetical protein
MSAKPYHLVFTKSAFKVIELTERKLSIETLLTQASEENLILKTAEGREFVLAELDEFDREVVLVRQNKALMGLLDRRSRQKGKLSLAQVKKELGL